MDDHKPVALTSSREREAATASGYAMLLVLLAALAAEIYGIASLANDRTGMAPIAGVIVGPLLLVLIAPGFYMLQPNQAAAITLFGDYKGTDRVTGLRWVWPWLIRKKVSVRANNFISDKIKVNDLRGNPIEMAAQIVWRVIDTAHAEVTLRGNHDEVGVELRKELIARLAVAGITVDECGFTHLAYSPEIAGAMLRRQQAQAVVAARATLVEGAVGMVQMALEQLSAKGVVELDDERRAAMVSNLMVVLCGERDTQPVVNAGSLYQ